MVSLGYQESKSDVQRWNHICDGSILSNRTIITSGDCLDMLSNEIKDVETKLQIRVADEDFNDDHDDDDDDEDDNDDDDDGVKVYFADGFRKHDSNVALIATNEYIEFNDETVKPLGIQNLLHNTWRTFFLSLSNSSWNFVYIKTTCILTRIFLKNQ